MSNVPSSRSHGGDRHVLYHRPGHCAFGRVANVALQAWQGSPNGDDARALYDLSEQMKQMFPNGLSSIHWMRSGGGMPSADAREPLIRSLKEHGPHFGQLAVVVDGDGFWAGAARSLLTSLGIAAGGRESFRIFATLADAVAWLPGPHAQRTGTQVDASDLREHLGHLIELG